MSRVRAQRGFTTIELLIALFITSTGIFALISTLDMSRRLTTLSEMKEVMAHEGQKEMERIRALPYEEIALNGTPATSTDPANPGYYVTASATGATYRWNQTASATTNHTSNLLICTTTGTDCPELGAVPAAGQPWSDSSGRLSGQVYRYVTTVDDSACTVSVCPGTSDYKRVTVAVTIDQPGGPSTPILFSALVADPDTTPAGEVSDGSENPLTSPDTQCVQDDVVVDCVHDLEGGVSSLYLYDTPATSSVREEIAGSHPTHPTVAPGGTCTDVDTTGCPVPDLMGVDPPPAPAVTPPLYTYSNEITGGTWPGGSVIRRDTTCGGTPSTTDNTKGHMWVTAPLSAPMTVTGAAALSISTATFNAVSAAATLCVRFYNVPGSIANLVATPPTEIGSDSYTSSTWPTSATKLAFTMDFRENQPDYEIPQGNRLGVRIWVSSSAGADLAAVYDHPLHPSYLQVNEAAE